MKNKYKIIILTVLMVVSALVIIFWLLTFLQNKSLSLQQQISEKKQTSSENQAANHNIIASYNEYHKLNKTDIEKIFFSTENTLQFVNSLENLAQDNNCILNIDLSDPQSNAPYEMLNLGLTLSCTLNDALNYINRLEQQEYYINYSGIIISTSEQAPHAIDEIVPEDFINMKISAKTYWN
ncbi:MAG: hypothetical protein V1898_01750 [Patescibacteria group bacterium]